MNNLNIEKWKWFKITDIFRIEKSKNIVRENLLEIKNGKVPYVTRSEYFNGINFFVDKNDHNLEKGNCITIGGEGANVFYQSIDFISGNNINKLYSNFLNKDNALFIVSILNLEKYRYSYGRAFNKKCIEKTFIKLPSDSNGNIDWKYMENYIISLREKEKDRILSLFTII